jgi:mono/diheme cytochrome c family protein
MKSIACVVAFAVGAGAAGSALGKLGPEQLAKLPAPAARKVNFSADIQPILETSCAKCHARGKAQGGFRLETRATLLKGGHSGPAVVEGNSAGSYLIELVSGLDPDNVMPQKGSKLSAAQVSLLRAWIDQGVEWDAAVSLAKSPPLNLTPRRPDLPPARAGVEHPIDRLLEPYWAQHAFRPPTVVEDRVFARRVYLDVWGLLPSPADLQAFGEDARPDKRARLVDRLLADGRRYAEHWLSFWNDALRNDYRGTGYIDGGRKQITSWLFAALATNLPYDRFVAQLVNPPPESEGFVKGIIWRGVVNASQTPEMQAAQNIAQLFMGVNLKCASCHDSFIDDWTLADAYGLAAVYADGPLEMSRCDKPTGQQATARFLYPQLGDIDPGASKAAKQQRLADILTSPANGRLTRTAVNRLWQKLMGRGLVEPADQMEQPAWHPALLDWLAEDLGAHGYDLKHTLKLILTSRAYQLPAVGADEQVRADYVFTGPTVRRMTAEQFRDALGTLTGVWFERPAAAVDLTAGAPSGQRAPELMPRPPRWIWTVPEAATRALAETVYFRKTFSLEAVPDEALAVAACDNSYTLYVNGAKAVSGKDFTQPNFADVRTLLRPGENVLAVRAINHTPGNQAPATGQPPREADANPAGLILYLRLRHAEQVRDVVTDATWTFSKVEFEGWTRPGTAPNGFEQAQEVGDADAAPWQLRRKLAAVLSIGLLHGATRSSLVAADPLMSALGRPPREQMLTARASTATTLQALELTNGETLSRLLQQGAEKVLAERPASGVQLVHNLYAKALGRPPNAKELPLASGLLGSPIDREHVEDLLWAMVMLPEFQLIY